LTGKINIAVQLAGAFVELFSTKESVDFTFTIPGVQEITFRRELLLSSVSVSSVLLLCVMIKTFCIKILFDK
jgi:hypothetical protein